MPIWLRKLTFHKLKEYYSQQDENSSSNSVEQSIANMKAAGAVAKQEVSVPSYVTKASKKWCLLIFIVYNNIMLNGQEGN